MSHAAGLKHVATEPTRLESKRERRRVGSGRASALRRAPSDSDCSVETASLSADSGERARPPPPPPRTLKSRSRRRGSEWEVLEGLKDGQRFDKRPEVFNGYLHKKRKWPLKGWHKRFFVVDGGILVYARSPTDVARGRLHGSVDVGLSVISAKARRRRIDIDADEFIYHLRAKTPDVFRTWLTVLKTHRLYRQHLLTFGARESVPKIHAPLEELPPTDTSSRSTHSSFIHYFEDMNLKFPCDYPLPKSPSNISSSRCIFKSPNPDDTAKFEANKLCLNLDTCTEPIDLNVIKKKINDIRHGDLCKHKSLCSMHCVDKNMKEFYNNVNDNNSPIISLDTVDTERETHHISFNMESANGLQSSLLCKYSLNSPIFIKNGDYMSNDLKDTNKAKCKKEKTLPNGDKEENAATYFFFPCLRRNENCFQPLVRKSKKSTNLVKYQNKLDEPTLKKPLNNCMLLKKYIPKSQGPSKENKYTLSNVSKKHITVQADELKESDLIHNRRTAYDEIAEKLMVSIFENCGKSSNPKLYAGDVNIYVNEIINELNDAEQKTSDAGLIKSLFRCLLEYWLKNTMTDDFKSSIMKAKSVDRQSNKYFTRDNTTSNVCISNEAKATQFHGISDFLEERRSNKICFENKKYKKNVNKSCKAMDSFMKERRIQELEEMLKNTVYICETMRSDCFKEKDIIITRKLIDNLEKISRKKIANKSDDNAVINSDSSNELPQIQDTLNHLICETTIPPDVAKEFLGAYLDLLHENQLSESLPSTDESASNLCQPRCDVQTESIQKKVSISISTKEFSLDTNKQSKNNVLDSNQLYLKHLLSKITSIFSIENKTRRNLKQKVSDWNDINLKSVKPLEKDIIVKASINKDLLSIERINDENNLPSINKIEMLCKQRDLVKHSDNNLKDTTTETNKWFINSLPNFDSNELFKGNNDNNYHKMEQNSFINFNKCNSSNNIGIHLKPYESSNENYAIKLNEERYEPKFCFSESDVTSKGYRIKNESINSIDKNSYKFEDHSNVDNDAQSCFILSLKRGILTPKFKSKNNINNDSNLVTDVGTPSRSVPSNYSQEISIFENPPKVIDEQFILLLFENLTLLSKNVPSVYKDINNLYQKLRKRHGKVLPTNKSQGLSLLGKIYNQEVNVKSTLDNETQFEAFLNSCDNGLIKQQNATNTSRNLFTAEIATSTARLKTLEALETEHTELKNIDLAEESNAPKFENSIHNSSTQTTTFSSMSSEEEILKTDKAISNQNWYHQLTTRDCAMSTIIKCVLGNSGSSENFKFLGTRHEGVTNQAISIKTCNQYTSNQALYIAKKLKNDRRHAPKLRQNLIKEIALLSPSFKVSTQSQTEKKLRCLRDKSMNRDFKVYQLFLSQKYELKRSNSMIDSTEDFQIDDELKTIYRCSSDPYISGLASPASPLRGPQAGFVSGTPGGRLASWIIESGGNLDSAGRELGQAQLSVQQLQRLVDALELQQQAHHDTDVSLEGASPNVKKDRRKFGLRKKKSSNKCASVELSAPQEPGLAALSALTAPPSPGGASSAPNSAASLPLACAATRPQSLPGAEALHTPASLSSLTPDHQLREDFTVLAKDLVASLKTIVATMVCERGRLRAAVEAADGAASPGGVLTALRTNLNSALRQNSELRTRLSRIHDASDLADVSSLGHQSDPSRPFPHSPSYSSSCVSASEFFDAEEPDELKAKILEEEAGVIELDGDSTSEAGSLSTEDGSASSDNSDAAIPQAEDRVSSTEGSLPADGRQSTWSRRTRLPRARPSPAPPSLWNLLYKNIGKDLSQISMPVTINEPLNMLQRLCEELEYSELLDAAARCTDAVERCALVAAFAVSAYAAAAHRAASKPFNPLLAETYECIRQDRGFKFVAEQVSHHPPISACHADAARWQFWQEARIKTKFWGKSMEFQPAGRVHVRLAGHHYSWNKVTTCVHNLFGGQRWVDQYGDMVVTCHGTDISCKLNFIKASSWSNSRHEVRGAVSAGAAGRLRLQGRWSEALLAGEPPAARCLWRPGAMPPEHELYYGFTRFAMELNEMEPALRDALPHTDTRHRPDQRALEEGDIEAAERFKLELEQAQRQRRRDQPDHTPAWFRKSVEDGEETWVFTGEYWKEREAGFPAPRAPRLW